MGNSTVCAWLCKMSRWLCGKRVSQPLYYKHKRSLGTIGHLSKHCAQSKK